MAKEVPEIFEQRFGDTNIEVDTGLFTISMCKKVGRTYAEVKAKLNDVSRFPMNPGEKVSDWEKRIQPEKDLVDVIRRKEESPWEHAVRMEMPSQVGIDIYVDLLNAITKLINQPQITQEELEGVMGEKAFDFMFRIMKLSRVLAPEYFPTR